jgi:enterochelin esterase-like enzyme
MISLSRYSLVLVASALSAVAVDYINSPAPARSEGPYLRKPGDYPVNPDATPREGVPRGTVEEFAWNDSQRYAGTTRSYWVYTPAQYDASKPTATMVFLDGGGWLKENRPLRANVVMDNLIADGLMPVTVGIFVDPGQRPPLADEGRAPPNPNLPLNRRIEYDSIDDHFASFLAEEIIPQVRARRNLSSDPENWAIVGNSSGGIGAFNAAWQRPDLFGKVAVHNGTFVNLLGGDIVPQWVLESDRKSLRVSLTSGPYDLQNEYGVWWTANLAMERALHQRGYDYRTFWTDNPHNSNLAGAMLSETFRWLWRDHPEVAAQPSSRRSQDYPVLVQIPAPPLPATYANAPVAYTRVPDDYPTHPDSVRDSAVPEGRIEELLWADSQIYPGTARPVWVYIPAQYTEDTAAALMVFQDGRQFVSATGRYHMPEVLDRLIAAGDMPPTIAVFIEPGDYAFEHRLFPAPIGPRSHQPANRRDEYDNIDDRYVRFLIEEILPLIEPRFNLFADPAMRALVGNSSGGSAAFNAAWHRPDVFGKVVSHIGSFTAIRGAHHYPQIVRESPRRPLRIFLQSGVNDRVSVFGNWWEANLAMAAELEAKGYDLKTVWGDGRHSPKHSAAIFPDTMRWLWRDWAAFH